MIFHKEKPPGVRNILHYYDNIDIFGYQNNY